MKKAISLLALLCPAVIVKAQHSLIIQVKDADTHAALPAATVTLTGTPGGATTNSNGVAKLPRPNAGPQTLSVRFIGYKNYNSTLQFPRVTDTVLVALEPVEEKMEEVVISSTRTTRTIQNIPTRVEFIGGEELEEKGNMKPGDIRMMLAESTGIQTQQVSATSANSSIRIQGLDGRYTQLLRDGFPLYAGFSGGLGLLQTPPLDLKQVEVIKGASSTLYGGGAIAGLVNLISRLPVTERDLRLMANGTSAGGLDLNGFYGQRFGKTGITLFASRNTSRPYAPGSTDFTAIPNTDRYVFNPKLFLYFSPKTTLSVGVNTTFEDRKGGDIRFTEGKGDSTHRYFENNKSSRLSSQVALTHHFDDRHSLQVKNAVSFFSRTLAVPGYIFDGDQWSSYSEINYSMAGTHADWIFGANYYTDDFKEHPGDSFPRRDYDQQTIGLFAQNTWKVKEWLQTELGLRSDYVSGYGWALMPRIAALFKITPKLSSRIGGGFGYKTPTIFTEETERIQFKSVLPVNSGLNKLERSAGTNFDINYHTSLGNDIGLTVNQLFFLTSIDHPLLLEPAGATIYQLRNVDGHLSTKGWETNVKLSYGDFKLFLGYTFTDAHLRTGGNSSPNPLTARHKLNNVLMYELEDNLKIGLEAYYTGTQPLSDGAMGKSYWTCGLMAEKIWKHFSLFVNFENLTDTRQTKFDTIYTGTVSNPVFRDIYAPLDGFVVNGGIKVTL